MTDTEYLLFDDKLSASQTETSVVTVERAAYVAVGLLAAGLRFFQLGLRPLNGGEALQALSAFRFVQGTVPVAPAGTVPALFTGNTVAFGLVGASDIAARWLPALAGLILVLLPYGLRHRLGRGGALAASLLLAISPSAVFFSRTLDSAILVAACGLAMVVGLINYLDTRRPAYLYLAAMAMGLGLVAGPDTYTLLLIFGLFALLLFLAERLLGHDTGWSSLVAAWWAFRGEKGLLATTGVVLAASFGLAATTFVLHPAGVGHAADLIGSWAQSFLPDPGGQPFVYPLLLLLRYEPLVLLLGLVEMIWWVASHRSNQQRVAQSGSAFPQTAFLCFWAVAALLVVLASGHRTAGRVLLVLVPLALLAGQGIERAWRWVTRRRLWSHVGVFAAVAVGLFAFFYLQLAAYGLTNNVTTFTIAGLTIYDSTSYLLLAFLALLLLAGLAAVAWIWQGRAVALAGCWLTALIVLGLFQFRAMWGLNFSRASDARELMILETAVPDVRLLVERLEALSLEISGDAHTLALTIDTTTGPIVDWYLRDFDQKHFVEDLSNPPDTAVAVTLAAQDLPIGETFRGQSFPLQAHWLPWGLRGQSLVRWLLFTDGELPVVDREVVLWVASEP